MATKPSFKGKEIRLALLKKGFQLGDQKRHQYLWLYVNGKKTAIRTHVSHGNKDYTGDLFQFVKRQLKIDSEQLTDLIGCVMDSDGYVSALKDSGHLKTK